MLIKVAADEHVERIIATVLLSNGAMQALLRKAGFRVRWEVGAGECTAELDL
jgi:RimJ/RimL family protein N-acetyltransferase